MTATSRYGRISARGAIVAISSTRHPGLVPGATSPPARSAIVVLSLPGTQYRTRSTAPRHSPLSYSAGKCYRRARSFRPSIISRVACPQRVCARCDGNLHLPQLCCPHSRPDRRLPTPYAPGAGPDPRITLLNANQPLRRYYRISANIREHSHPGQASTDVRIPATRRISAPPRRQSPRSRLRPPPRQNRAPHPPRRQ